MTTIAYRDGVLAFDSRVTVDTQIAGSVIKGKVLASGELIAICGDVAQGQLFIKWAEEGFGNTDTLRILEAQKLLEFQAVLITKDKRMLEYSCSLLPTEYYAKMYAWGSGSHFALGAMMFGATAEEAVKVAIKLDAASGGPVRSIKLEDTCKKKRTRNS